MSKIDTVRAAMMQAMKDKNRGTQGRAESAALRAQEQADR